MMSLHVIFYSEWRFVTDVLLVNSNFSCRINKKLQFKNCKLKLEAL